MKTEIHPDYVEAQVTCTCGNAFTTRSTTPVVSVEICSQCHPFYTGKQKLMDTGGRVERFRRRAAKVAAQKAATSAEAGAGAAAPSPAPAAPAAAAPETADTAS
jgi:large subunit ribosomal protein L31